MSEHRARYERGAEQRAYGEWSVTRRVVSCYRPLAPKLPIRAGIGGTTTGTGFDVTGYEVTGFESVVKS